MLYLTVDGMLSGTGIRDAVQGGYLAHEKLGLSTGLSERIIKWLARYEDCHWNQFENEQDVVILDTEGIAICRLLRSEIPNAKIGYFSNAKMVNVPLS